MTSRIASLPYFLVLMGAGAALMIVPALHALYLRQFGVALTFLVAAGLLGIVVLMIAVALGTSGRETSTGGQLLSLVAALLGLPVMFAVPFALAAAEPAFLNAWFEMVSSFTTTGATLYPEPGRLPPTLHLWRALVGWMGGLLIWVAGLAILAPMNLGGFEVIATDMTAAGHAALRERRAARTGRRLRRYTAQLAPIYLGLSFLLWLGLILTGETPFRGAIVAMSTLSTSGITPGPWDARSYAAEAVILVFLLFGVSRLTFRNDSITRDQAAILRDPELRLGLSLCVGVALVLLLRHWIGAFEGGRQSDDTLAGAVRAFWGALFTALSFLTTTGFQSVAFESARAWSGLQTPGLILVGLALIGGGVATTAGGVKLLRIYALYRHGRREITRLVYPDSVGGAGASGRRLRRQGAFVAWIFFMLFAVSVAVVMAALSLAGQDFESAAILSVSALSTTGPLAGVATEAPISYRDLSAPARAILALAMVVGRLEALALIAVLGRDVWRR